MVPGTDYGMFNDLGVYGVPRLVRERKRWANISNALADLCHLNCE